MWDRRMEQIRLGFRRNDRRGAIDDVRMLKAPSIVERRAEGVPVQDLSDEELNSYISTRLKILGVDLSVLPEDDEDAPADQKRIMESARQFLRNTPRAIIEYYMDPQEVPPEMYPAALAARLKGGPHGD